MIDAAWHRRKHGRAVLEASTLATALALLAGCSPSSAPAPAGNRAPQADMHAPANRPTTAGKTPEGPVDEPAAPALPPKNAEPPYDLAADIEERTNTAKADLGPRVEVLVVDSVSMPGEN